ncbi:MAG: hypothetical protein VKO39_07825 [Cyanobacteriota bacterium]|nr:hypothetical protein [Cyanobacteriota bacterium]
MPTRAWGAKTIKILKAHAPLTIAAWQHVAPIQVNSMASALAHEQPSIKSAWDAFRAHLPAVTIIWTAYILVSVLGIGVSLILRSLDGVITAILGGDEMARMAAVFIEQVAQMPFIVVSSLIYVLFLAVPALYYAHGEVITPGRAFAELLNHPLRYFLAGFLFFLLMILGFMLCIIPGLVIGFVMPIYVHRIFLTNQSIPDAFAGSFQSVYRSANGLNFVGSQVLIGILLVLVTVCTCGLGGLVALPMSNFYIFHLAHHKGLIH